MNSYTKENLIYKGFFEEITLTGSFEIPSGMEFDEIIITSSLKGFKFGTPDLGSGGTYSFTVEFGDMQKAGTITVSAPWGDFDNFKIAVGTPSFLALLEQSFFNPSMKETDYLLVSNMVTGAMNFVSANCNRIFPDSFPCCLFSGEFPETNIQSFVDSALAFSVYPDELHSINLTTLEASTGEAIALEMQTKIREIGTFFSNFEVNWSGTRYIINTNLQDKNINLQFDKETNYSLLRALKLHPLQGALFVPVDFGNFDNNQMFTVALQLVSSLYNRIGSEGFSSLQVGEMSYQLLVEQEPILKGLLSANRRLF